MLIVDASCLYEVVADTAASEDVRAILARDEDHGTPHLIDVEVLNVIRRDHLLGRLDATAAITLRSAAGSSTVIPPAMFT